MSENCFSAFPNFARENFQGKSLSVLLGQEQFSELLEQIQTTRSLIDINPYHCTVAMYEEIPGKPTTAEKSIADYTAEVAEQQAQHERQLKKPKMPTFQTAELIPEPRTPQYNRSCIIEQRFEVCLHRSGGLLTLEFEPVPTHVTHDISTSLRKQLFHSIVSIQRSASFRDVVSKSAIEVRKLLGFDRVMIYQFRKGGHGEVIAEDMTTDFPLDSFLGLHYPATDIPAQARILYVKNKYRMIGDVANIGSPLVPQINPISQIPFDLTYSVLRSVHPVHIQYLRNMGVRSSMSISIVHK